MKAVMRYFGRAQTIYQIHSPLLYSFVSTVLDTEKNYYYYRPIEQIRQELIASNEVVKFLELGQGRQGSRDRKIAEIAKTSLSPQWKCRILASVCRWKDPKRTMELGTSLGISTAYIAHSMGATSTMYTMEGNPSSARIAQHNFGRLGIDNIRLVMGPFEDTLEKTLEEAEQLDLVYLDGNHSEKATLEYFDKILPYCHDKTVIVMDDIYWSAGMESAWNSLKQQKQVTASLDTFQLGFLFFDPAFREKIDITYIPTKFKIWQKFSL